MSSEDVVDGQAVDIDQVADEQPADSTGEGPAELDADDRWYRLEMPAGGYVLARIASEDAPVLLAIRHPELDARLVLPRDVAWAMFAILSDGLMTERDAVPDWAAQRVIPRDQDGQPFPGFVIPYPPL